MPVSEIPDGWSPRRIWQDVYDGDAHKKGLCDRMAEVENEMELIQQWRREIHPDVMRIVATVGRTTILEEQKAKDKGDRDASLKRWIGICTLIITVVHLFGANLKALVGIH